MPNEHVVVLSDVHIGNDANTCWYQTSVHEPYLLAALDWIVQNAGMFQEVILLGDLVDTWTYPPSVRPPSMADIIAANPKVLGPDGALARVVKAVPKVTYLLGNHDGTLTNDDIAALQQSVGPVQLNGTVHTMTGSSGAKTTFSHGHLWTMFNAPDDRMPLGNLLPVGHFVTRAFSYMMENKLQPGQTVADLSGMGYPSGFDLSALKKSFNPTLNPDLAGVLLDYVSTVSNMPGSLPVVLPNGATTSIEEAKKRYADLYTWWVNHENGSKTNAARAALADYDGNYLAWFAQRLAIRESADLVVMGHTHTPVGGLSVAPVNYTNSGFECASVPDNPPHLFTFTVVDLEAASAQIMKVNHDDYAISVAPIPALPSVVLPPAMDYSCYVRIINESGKTLTLEHVSAGNGYWAVPPPETIPAGGRGDAWLQDYAGAHGSDGKFSYKGGGKFSVDCPTGFYSNSITGAGGNFIARSGSGDWANRGSVPAWGHPLQVIFTVGG